MGKKRILLLDMYGVIIKESKGYFIPYTFEHFDKKEHDRLTRTFREECLFTKAGNGELSSDAYTIKHLQCILKGIHCNPQECVFVDNSVQNLNAAQEAGINAVLFNRDNEVYSGDIVNNVHELSSLLKNMTGF